MRLFSKSSHKDVLVVDDDPVFIRILAFYLEKSGFRLDTAINGLSALDLLHRASYRAALVDFNMPGMNGFELSKKIRENPNHRGMYIIIMSGEKESVSPAPEIFDEFVTKPFDMKVMIEKLTEPISHEDSDNKQEAVTN